MIDLDKLFSLTERVRKQAIGDPVWIVEKEVFEYTNHSAPVVAALKVVRAAQGVEALHVLCNSGLFIDMGVIFRCICECEYEIYFLLEEFPKTSTNADQFVRAFFETTIDGYLSAETEAVPTKKIRSAVVRVLHDQQQNEETRARIERVYKTFSGYVHANYAHVMEMFGGRNHDFNLRGVLSPAERERRSEYVELASNSVLFSGGYVARGLGADSGLLRLWLAVTLGDVIATLRVSAAEAIQNRASAHQPRLSRLSTRSLTTAGSARVEMSPS
jgi:hypothetical protein